MALILPLWLALMTAPDGSLGLGNVDGVLTLPAHRIASGESVLEAVVFAFADDYAGLPALLEEAREAARSLGPPADGVEAEGGKVWLEGARTDFALEDMGYFRWRIERQALACPHGGQLSQFTYFVHYASPGGESRAGVPHIDELPAENIHPVGRVRSAGPGECFAYAATDDGRLSIRVRAVLDDGPWVVVQFELTNSGTEALDDVRLTVYANIEARHDHENDMSVLDAGTEGLLVVDPITGACVAMAALGSPVSGHAGVWNSVERLRTASGLPREEWTAYDPDATLDEDLMTQFVADSLASSQGIYLPYTYTSAETPETRTLSPDEAQDAVRRDWLLQAEGKPLLERTRDEIAWTLALAARLAVGPGALDVAPQVARLEGLSRALKEAAREPVADDVAQTLYFQVRETKRELMFRNSAIDFGELVFIDQPTPRGRVNPEHEAIHRMGITATPGGRLLHLRGLHPGGEVRLLAPERPGSFWKPDVSFDGSRVLFAYKAFDEGSFHLYEIGVDGSGLRQLTHGEYDDIDPITLPDGHILFTTTRGNSYVRCGPFIWSYTLARCNADGSDVYLISHNGEPDFVPSLMADGRVIYSRWEYTDRPLWRIQSLWTANPDGTDTQVFWGNASVWPDHLAEPRQIPGSHRIMFAGVGHHDWFSGSIGIVDPRLGRDYPDGLTKVTADLRWPECSPPPEDPIEAVDYHSSGAFTGYLAPYPLSEEDLLVSARGPDGRFRLYLMDIHGNRELIYEGAHNVWYAIPVRPRPIPPALSSQVIWPGTGGNRGPVAPGALFSTNVYEGDSRIEPGAAHYLRVVQLDHKTYSTWRKSYRHSGPAVSIVQEEGVKRILAEAPLAADGSVSVEVPAGKSVYFQLLDADRRCIQTMRSFTGVMPGEKRGCVGCHQGHSTAPPVLAAEALIEPVAPEPIPWGDESIGYERFVQPVIDRYCGQCHQGDGEARDALDLTLRPGVDVFKEPYLTLVGDAGWGNPVGGADRPGYGIAGVIPVESMDPTMNAPEALATLEPGRYLSSASELVRLASSGEHYGVRMDDLSLRRLMAWVDLCGPYMGEPELRALGDPDFEGIDLLPIRPRVATAPVVERP